MRAKKLSPALGDTSPFLSPIFLQKYIQKLFNSLGKLEKTSKGLSVVVRVGNLLALERSLIKTQSLQHIAPYKA